MSAASTGTPPPTNESSPSTPPPARPAVKRRGGRAGIYAAIGVVIVVVILVAVGASTNWYGLQKSSSLAACSSGVTLQGDGAQVATPLVTAWTSPYQTKTGNIVNYGNSGSGTGLSEFTKATIDFAMTDDPLTAAETTALPGQALTLPFVGGALTIIYNLPGIAGHLNLTGPVLAEIYQGNITTWNNSAIVALNPGVTLPNAQIVTVHRLDNAGTTYVLSDFLSQSSAYWAKNVGKGISISFPKTPGQLAEKGNSLLISTVVSTKYSIGYSDLTDVLAAASPPQYAAIENPAKNFIVPTITSTISAIADKVASMTSIPSSTASWFNVSMVNANGTSDYPIATFLYMFVYQATDKGFSPTLVKSQVLVQWINWVLTTGQSYANQPTSELYYAPLPAAIVSVDQAGIQTMTFNGASIPACK